LPFLRANLRVSVALLSCFPRPTRGVVHGWAFASMVVMTCRRSPEGQSKTVETALGRSLLRVPLELPGRSSSEKDRERRRQGEAENDGYVHLREAIADDDARALAWMVAFLLLGFGAVVIAVLASSTPLRIAAGAIAAALTLTGMLLRYPLGTIGVRRELAWLKSFAFAVKGY